MAHMGGQQGFQRAHVRQPLPGGLPREAAFLPPHVRRAAQAAPGLLHRLFGLCRRVHPRGLRRVGGLRRLAQHVRHGLHVLRREARVQLRKPHLQIAAAFRRPLGLLHGNAQRRQDVPPLPAHVQRGLCRNVGRLRQRARGFLQRSGQRVRRGLPREGAAQRRRKRPVAGREVLRLPRL